VASIRDDNDEYQSYNVTLADGRTLSVDSTSEESARRLAREQGGNVGVLSVELNESPDAEPDDDDAPDDVTPVEGNAGGGTAPLPTPTDERAPGFVPETGEPIKDDGDTDAPTFVDVAEVKPSAYDDQ